MENLAESNLQNSQISFHELRVLLSSSHLPNLVRLVWILEER